MAIIRISGPEAVAVASALTPRLRPPASGRHMAVHTLRWDGRFLDQAVVLVFRAPASFTGEDCVELQVHGGRLNTARVLDAVIAAGARLAEPGEFTRRALLNGRLDLTRAEGIAEVIHARSEAALRLGRRHLDGELDRRARGWREQLLHAVVLLEAAIDFSLEEHVFTVTHDELLERIDRVAADLQRVLATADAGRLMLDGVRLVIAGLPNAGKSSLLNRLLGRERALVSPVAGTTRDSVEETLQIDGVAFRLADTAGLSEHSHDPVEALGIARTHNLAAEADLVVWLFDATQPSDPPASWDVPVLRVANKIDLLRRGVEPSAAVAVSCATGVGLDALRAAILHASGALAAGGDEPLIGRARHRDCVSSALQTLLAARALSEQGAPQELIAIELRASLSAIASLTGAVTTDDVLNRIFEGFCVGK